ncbi:phosphoribosylanthranilate isomerase [Chryseobacterium sp. L7]|uniref:N-(5'-phosphoribosyl)anthranilate isomerase n=1 Tax=Chryseobacterium endalhagicum TaxID=2797638 RepID=A0ABS1QJF1_9FLAO|nr:phosphoribosylanthranilate isomerase [Chryseobacterium endalhagicum]MBL1222741.1 phosphoribosylanthranilate isomerase [Chryseobacterium endalhagicum]
MKNGPPSKLKVCGLTKLDQIQELISMKTDFLGFIFYEKSPRYVLNHLELKDIAKINHPGKTGVFVNEDIDNIIRISENAELNLIQLHGDENEDFILELKQKLHPDVKIIKVIRMGSNNGETRKKTEEKINSGRLMVNYFLFDTDSKAFGGTGKQFDWTLLDEMEIPLPYFLSGGISEGNIENISLLKQKPYAIDINSKFEIDPGNKDIEKIKKTFQKSPNGTI